MLDSDVWRYFPLGPLPTMAVGLVGMCLLAIVGISNHPAVRWLASVLLGATIMAILGLTLTGGGASVNPSLNLYPGAGIRAELDNVNQALGWMNVMGNVAMFFPLGWLNVVVAESRFQMTVARSVVTTVCAGLLLSLSIESLQYLLGRAADVDDILLNTAGTSLGALLAATLVPGRGRTKRGDSRAHHRELRSR